MAGTCAPLPSEPFLTGTVHFLDCSGRAIGAFGYAGVGSGSGAGSPLLLAGLTLAIAFLGLRWMFGERLSLSAPVELVARIAMVLLLALSWPAARTLFFDVAFEAPAELSASLTGGSPSGERSSTLAPLQTMDDAMVALTTWGTGREELNAVRTASGQPAARAFSGVAVSDRLAMGAARVTFLLSTILIMGGLRLIGGILFALLPLLAVFGLFRPTEGLLVGWARAMLAVVLAGASGMVLLSLETAFATPWLGQRIAERAQAIATPTAPTELLVLTLLTGILALITAIALARISFAHFPMLARAGKARGERRDNVSPTALRVPSAPARLVAVSRETALAGSVSRLMTREVATSQARDQRLPTDSDLNSGLIISRPAVPMRHQLRQSRAARLRSGMA